jgi:hypothetical protein
VGTGHLDLWQPEPKKKIPDPSDYGTASGRIAGMGKAGRIRPNRLLETPELPPEEVVLGITQQGQKPLLPGSSLKGAVRQVFELLTPSCDPTNGDQCKANGEEGEFSLCPACHLFGVSSFGGRVDFRDARWTGPGQSGRPKGLDKERVPKAWQPREHMAPRGTYRMYELREDRHTSRQHRKYGQKRDQEVPVLAAFGVFVSQVHLRQIYQAELAILLLSLGLGAPRPGLRLGGKKFHGLGALDVTLTKAEAWSPEAGPQPIGDSVSWVNRLLQQAQGDRRRKQQWQTLHEIWSRTQPRPGGGP